MEGWVWVLKDRECMEKLYENNHIELYVNQSFKRGDKLIVYRSIRRDLKWIFEVKKDSEPSYGKQKLIIHNKITFKNSVELSELKKDPEIKKWRCKFTGGFYKIPFTQWNRIIGMVSKNNPGMFEKHTPECCSGPDSDGFPVNYANSFMDLIEKIRKCKNKDSFNEETTKQLIVLPLLQKLGWNTYDVCEVHPEHHVHHKTNRVDYILRDHKSGQVCLEVKMVGKELDPYKKQLLKYCAFKHADAGILTDGIIWRFYRIHFHSKNLGAIKKATYKEINLINDDIDEIIEFFINYLFKGKKSMKHRLPIRNPSFKEVLDDIKSIGPVDRKKFNEEAMKQGIINPLLNNMGWNTFDPDELQFEKSIYVPNRGKKHKIDYILGKFPEDIIVEVKGLGDDFKDKRTINRHEEHLLDYMEAGNHNFGVLTNGKIWKFCLVNDDEGFCKCRELNFENENVGKKDLEALISKKAVNNGTHLTRLQEMD